MSTDPTTQRPSHRRSRLRNHRRIAAAGAALVLVAACSNDRPAARTPDLDGVQLVAALQPFDRCEDFLSHVKDLARERVGAYGLDGGGSIAYSDAMPTRDTAAAAEQTTAGGDDGFSDAAGNDVVAMPAAPAPSTAAGQAESKAAEADAGSTGTNNQEGGVDEADIVKLDGDRIVTVRGNELVVVSLDGGGPRLAAKLDLGSTFYGDRLFLAGDRAYVMGSESDEQRSTAAVVEVSLADGPRVVNRTRIDGSILDGRLVDGTVRLVVTSQGGSGIGFVYPAGDSQRSIETAEESNRRILDESGIEDWVPQIVDGNGERRSLVECDNLYRPAEPSGFGILSIVTIADGLGSMTATGVLADGGTTYASTDHLYVATNAWASLTDEGDGTDSKRAASTVGEHTDIHSFSIAGADPADYQASGRVEGHVLNQYSMSQAGDVLRIATTVGPNFGAPVPMPMPIEDCPPDADCTTSMTEPAATSSSDATAQQGDSRIVTLRQDGETLQEIGKVGGLGVTEQIKSVRYVGDTAYVVTFRQTDPFYVVDLSDPTAPRVLGELKVPGFSSYLHPVGDHLVLGVGSDATNEGRITGAKLSLYDTTDPLSPKELDSWVSPTVGFMVDGDPHAFHWDGERSTAYLPFYGTCFDSDCRSTSNGVLVVTVAGGTITEVGRFDHENRTPSPDAPPETTGPETTTPETSVPETTVPDTTIPETSVPETTVPETTVPATTAPVAATETTIAARDGSTSSGVASAPAPGQIEPWPTPISPPICDPAACDPGPYQVQATITRVFVVGERVVSLSDAGIAAHDRNDLRFIGFAAF